MEVLFSEGYFWESICPWGVACWGESLLVSCPVWLGGGGSLSEFMGGHWRLVGVSIDAVFEGDRIQVNGLVGKWVHLRVGIFIEY